MHNHMMTLIFQQIFPTIIDVLHMKTVQRSEAKWHRALESLDQKKKIEWHDAPTEVDFKWHQPNSTRLSQLIRHVGNLHHICGRLQEKKFLTYYPEIEQFIVNV